MTEGPQARAIALLINRDLTGRVVRSIFTRSKKVHVPLENLVEKTLSGADSFGKNIVLFIDDYAIRVHPMMYGTVKLYHSGERIERPERQIRLRISFDDLLLVGFNTPVIEIDVARNIVNRLESSLGPDPFKPSWSREEAAKRLKERGDEKIGVVLLDQSVIAGIGNILRNEILYRAGINPERIVESLSDKEIERLLEITENLFRDFLSCLLKGQSTRSLHQVYNKYRGRCPRCDAPIKYYRQEPIRRKTFICPRCQK